MTEPPRVPLRPPRPRLASLRGPPRPAAKRTTPEAPLAQSVAAPKKKPDCCDDMDLRTDDNKEICANCGTIRSESSAMEHQLQFGETASGGVMVQGGFIGQQQRHANTMGGRVRGIGEARESRQQTEQRGEEEMRNICAALNITKERIINQAKDAYRLALNDNFVQGRRVRNVAAVVIYYACRRENHPIMLIDFAEQIQVNVWQLGDTYKQFLKAIMQDGTKDPMETHNAKLYNGDLMEKYCNRLEFGPDARKVAGDAQLLLKRMGRDWMTQGRQPAGLFGACIIIAARMNGFRRTVREVVYVVRVADSTINQRLSEFKRTQSSQLTVAQHRELAQKELSLPVKIMPPSVYKRAEREERKRKRAGEDLGPGQVLGQTDTIGGQSAEADSNQVSGIRRSTRKKRKMPGGAVNVSEPRRDEDGFAIPDVPNSSTRLDADTVIDTEALVDPDGDAHMDFIAQSIATPDPENDGDFAISLPKKKRGRPAKVRAPIVIPQEELEIEAEIEQEINAIIHPWVDHFKAIATDDNHHMLVRARNTATHLASIHTPQGSTPDSGDVREGDYESDDDVHNCILSEEEIRQKERIWVTDNEDWMRANQAKKLAIELAKAEGKEKKEKLKRNVSRMGDGSVLGGVPAESAGDAVAKMLKKRSKYSKGVDYDLWRKLGLGKKEETPSASASGSEVTSPAGSTPAASTNGKQQGPAETVTIEDDGEEYGEDEEEIEEEQDEREVEYDEDLEVEYEEELGFSEEEYGEEY